jgi:flagellar biosynthetic protein FliR
MAWEVATAELVAILLASIRAAAWLVTSPLFRAQAIPGIVKGLLSVAMALPIAPQLVANVPDPATSRFLTSVVEQVVIGGALGFLTSLLFAAVQAAGDLIDLFGGFSLAFAFDPFSHSGNSVVGRLYNLMATTLLFVTPGHQLIMRGFMTSYRVMPIDGTLSMQTLRELVTTGAAQMFLATLQIAGPLISILACVDIGLGLLNRVAPALNAFSMGFPLKILLTLGIAGIGIILLPTAVASVIDAGVAAVLRAVGG